MGAEENVRIMREVFSAISETVGIRLTLLPPTKKRGEFRLRARGGHFWTSREMPGEIFRFRKSRM